MPVSLNIAQHSNATIHFKEDVRNLLLRRATYYNNTAVDRLDDDPIKLAYIKIAQELCDLSKTIRDM